MPEELDTAQVEWFNATVRNRRAKWGAPIPSLVFVHIPLWEYQEALASRTEQTCFGDADEVWVWTRVYGCGCE